MKKFYKEISALLESVSSDKYIHYNVCLLIAYALMRTLPLPTWLRYVVAVTVTVIVGVGKEVYDFFDYGLFDKKDLLADCVGAVTGATLGI